MCIHALSKCPPWQPCCPRRLHSSSCWVASTTCSRPLDMMARRSAATWMVLSAHEEPHQPWSLTSSIIPLHLERASKECGSRLASYTRLTGIRPLTCSSVWLISANQRSHISSACMRVSSSSRLQTRIGRNWAELTLARALSNRTG